MSISQDKFKPGFTRAVLAILGALLSFGFVPAVVMYKDKNWIASSPGFLGAVAIGTLGLACFVIGCLGLRRKSS